MPLKDPEARRAYHRAYMKRRWAEDPEHRTRHRARTDRNHEKNAALVDELVAEFRKNGCSRCPEKEPCCLAAHHLDPNQKDFAIGEAKAKGYGWKKVKKELAKCICVCHNCHAKIHATNVG